MASAATDPLVLHVRVVTGAGGGPDKTILESPRFLAPAGFAALCVFLRHPRDPGFAEVERRAGERGAPLLAVDDRGALDLGVPRRLAAICDERRPAIWHGHDYKSNVLGLLLARRRPMRLVTTVHGWVRRTWKTPLYYALDRRALRRYEAVVCVSEDLERECLRLGVARERCRLVRNGVDTATFERREPREAVRRRLGVPPTRTVVGAAGRLSAEKGFDLLLDAVAGLIERGHDIEVRIAGDGDGLARLRERAARPPLAGRAAILGYRSDIIGFYHDLDVFVVSSLREGLPNALLEALALEVPAVATRVAGVPALVEDGVNGLLVEPGSAATLAAAIERLARDPALARRLGAAGRATVEASFGFDTRMASMISIYRRLLGRTREPG